MSIAPPPPGLTAPDQAAVVLYTTPWCGFCRAALMLLRARGVEPLEVDVMNNRTARQWLAKVSGQTTVPQIFIHGESIGGYTELAELDDEGELRSRLAEPS